jgi:hypothetical protein
MLIVSKANRSISQCCTAARQEAVERLLADRFE